MRHLVALKLVTTAISRRETRPHMTIDCSIMGMKINSYLEGDSPRRFSLTQEIFGDVLSQTAIDAIEEQPIGKVRARMAVKVFRQYRSPTRRLVRRLYRAYRQEPDLYGRRRQQELWDLLEERGEL